MSTQSTFYQARAAEERDKAEGSNLDNVRDGHLRAAAAWDALAARSLKADRMRAEEEVRKSEGHFVITRSAHPGGQAVRSPRHNYPVGVRSNGRAWKARSLY